MNKHAKMGSGMIFGLVIVGLIIWAVSKNPSTPVTPPGPGPEPSTTAACDALVTPQATINCYDENTGAGMTTVGTYRQVGTDTWRTFSCGTQIPDVLSCGVTYEFLIGTAYNSTGHTSNIDVDFGPYFTMVVPNQETFTKDVKVTDQETEAAITNRFLDSTGSNSPQAIGTSGSEQIATGFRASTDNVWGNPYLSTIPGLTSCLGGNRVNFPNTLCLYYNSSDVLPISDVKVNGQSLSGVSVVPWKNALTGFGGNASYGDSSWSCFDAPVITDTWADFEFTVDAVTGTDPTNRTHGSVSGGTSAGVTVNEKYDSIELNDSVSNIAVLYEGTAFIDPDTQKITCGVYDPDKNMTSTNVPAIFPLVWT